MTWKSNDNWNPISVIRRIDYRTKNKMKNFGMTNIFDVKYSGRKNCKIGTRHTLLQTANVWHNVDVAQRKADCSVRCLQLARENKFKKKKKEKQRQQHEGRRSRH